MKKIISSLAALAVTGMALNTSAGDREWAAAGKVLTGVFAGSIIARAFQPAPTVVYYSSPPVYAVAPPVYVQTVPACAPAPVMVQAAPVYVQPQVVYVQPAPAVVYARPAFVHRPHFHGRPHPGASIQVRIGW